MSTFINTGKVADRRQLHFASLEEIAAEVDRLTANPYLNALGNWSPAQIIEHLARALHSSIDGAPPIMPGFIRAVVSLFIKRRMLTRPMSPGFQLPAKANWLIPEPLELCESLVHFRHGIARLRSETKRLPHPVLGTLTAEEWEQLHCRHAELHLSFLVPPTVSGE